MQTLLTIHMEHTVANLARLASIMNLGGMVVNLVIIRLLINLQLVLQSFIHKMAFTWANSVQTISI